MSVRFEGRVREVLEGPHLAIVSTVGSKGTPYAQPTWFDIDGDTIRLNSVEGRTWPKRVRNNPEVSVCVVNSEETTEYVEVRGRIVEDSHEGADELIDELAHKYIGADYPNRFPGEQRIFFRVKPEKVVYVNLLEAIPAAPFGDQR